MKDMLRRLLGWRAQTSQMPARIEAIELSGTPVVVYQMGKVASSTIVASLQQAGVEHVYQVHYLQRARIEELIEQQGLRKHLATALALQEPLFSQGAHTKYITVVREPIARNVSAFFENLVLFTSEDVRKRLTVEGAKAQFLENYPHDIPLTWFDTELRESLGIDLFEQEFPTDEGFQVFELDAVNGELLVLQLEAGQEIMGRAIADFVGLERIDLVSANVGSAKDYADVYRAFKADARLPQSYVDRMLDSKYARHFYSDTARADIRKRWLE